MPPTRSSRVDVDTGLKIRLCHELAHDAFSRWRAADITHADEEKFNCRRHGEKKRKGADTSLPK